MASYSQHGEDALIAEYFGAHIGTLVEIGAFHPTTMSNSRLLIERGWSAVLVDCAPRAVRDLLLEYGRHPRVKVVQAAVCAWQEQLIKMEITDDALSTSDPETRAKWEGWGYYGVLYAAARPIRELVHWGLAHFWEKPSDFVSIDTEGTSIALAQELIRYQAQNRFEEQRCVKVICVEHDDQWESFLRFAKQHGYEQLAMNETNIVIARPK